jgi:crotonobetainyl-CoA:carnitine CoA-transferase CaiB-like acyl-CoA transferase
VGDRPLDGIRVLDFTWAWAGPFAMLQLAHLGAEVIRVETTTHTLCVTRAIPPFADNVPGPNRAGYFNQYNQGKRSITLSLRNARALEIIYKLVKHCDIVAENFGAGVSEKLGIGYSKLRQYKPDIIMISMSGYGQTGPFRRFIGYGPPAAAFCGFFSTTGYVGGEAQEIGVSYPDPNAGAFGVLALLAALIYRDATGEGQYIDQSQVEAATCVMAEGLLDYQLGGREPVRSANRDRVMAPHGCYKAKGDTEKWVAIAVGNEVEWRSLCAAMGVPGLAEDQRFATVETRKKNEDALDELITNWTRDRDRWEITQLLQSVGVAAFPSLSNKDLSTDPHLMERGFLVTLPHPEVGKRIHAGIPWKMSETPCEVRSPAPLLGADTESVLSSLLGYSREEIERLRKEGVAV